MSHARTAGAGLVVNASVAMKWLVDENGSEAALMLRDRDLMRPSPLADRDRQCPAYAGCPPGSNAGQGARSLFALLQDAPVTIVDHDEALEHRALQLGLELSHPVYDCFYLALAERKGRRLITADSRFLKVLSSTPYAALIIALEADRL